MRAPEQRQARDDDEKARRLSGGLPLVAVLALVVLALDQLAKTWAVRHLSGGRDVHVVGSLHLRLTLNSGGAFSLGTGNPWFFVAAAAVLLVALLAMGRSVSSGVATIALGLVVGGALGNLGDRLFRDTGGAVVDFIDLRWWPVFNLADAAITTGALVLGLSAVGLARRGE